MHLELNAQEAELLQKILQSHLVDLGVEIAGMDIPEFTAALERERALVENLLPRLESVLPAANAFGEYGQF